MSASESVNDTVNAHASIIQSYHIFTGRHLNYRPHLNNGHTHLLWLSKVTLTCHGQIVEHTGHNKQIVEQIGQDKQFERN